LRTGCTGPCASAGNPVRCCPGDGDTAGRTARLPPRRAPRPASPTSSPTRPWFSSTPRLGSTRRMRCGIFRCMHGFTNPSPAWCARGCSPSCWKKNTIW
jgi:hypothetical protein